MRATRFNDAWLKNGEKLNWFQRIGYAGFSHAFLYCGVDSGMCAFDAFREGGLGAFGVGASHVSSSSFGRGFIFQKLPEIFDQVRLEGFLRVIL